MSDTYTEKSSVLWILLGFLLWTGCSAAPDAEQAAPAASDQKTDAAPSVPFVPVDACALLTKGDVESLTGKTVMDPYKQEVANLVTCSWGDPEVPQLSPGRAVSQILTLDVFTGEEGAYFAGPVAQAREAFDLGRRNAASPQNVTGLGEDAYWDALFRTLHVYKDRYEVSVTVESGTGLDAARTVAERALAKLPGS
jgi:hypothetical protein